VARHSCSCRKKNVRAPSIPMSSSRAIRIPPPRTPIRRDRSTLLLRVGRWRKRARWVWRKLNAVPKAVRIVVIAATILAVFSATNLVYHVVRTNFRNFSCHLRDPSPLSFAKTESPFYDRGTEGSNPAPSAGESGANCGATRPRPSRIEAPRPRRPSTARLIPPHCLAWAFSLQSQLRSHGGNGGTSSLAMQTTWRSLPQTRCS
jgi:hypothetical protein